MHEDKHEDKHEDNRKDTPHQATLSRRRLLEYWWTIPVLGAGGFFAWFALRSSQILFGKPNPGPANFTQGQRITIARASELAQAWDFREFNYRLNANGPEIPAILIRTEGPQPGGLSVGGLNVEEAHFLALSRVCTHLFCVSTYIRDAEAAALSYNYRPQPAHPILGCACHFSAFDPDQAGKSVSGPAIEPLPRIKLELENEQIVATGLEQRL